MSVVNKDFVVQQGILTKGVDAVTSSTGQLGTLQVTGGAAIAKNLIVGTTATVWGPQTNKNSLTVEGLTTLQSLFAEITTSTQLAVNSTATFLGQVLITNNTAADWNGDQAALEVTGGAIVNDKLYVKSTSFNDTSKYDNAIYTPGGIWTDKGLTVDTGGTALFKGAVVFSGTATYAYSTNTVFSDNLINVHIPPGSTGTTNHTWTLDDGKDIGLIFHYYKTTDKDAFLGLANDTGYLEWYSEGSESDGVYTGTTYGTFKTGGIRLVGGQANAGNTSSGDLQVLGGVGINGGLFVGGVITATNFSGSLLGGTSNQLVYQSSPNTTAFLNTGTSGQFLQSQTNGAPVWTSTGSMYVNSSVFTQNIYGGAAGSLIFQSLPNATTSLAIGTNGYVLSVVAGAPAWVPASGLSSGVSSTATNIDGGLADQIPYQSAPGTTTFSNSLTFNGTTFTTTNIVVSGTTNSSPTTSTQGALTVAGGVGIAKDLYVGGDVNIGGSLYLKGVGVTDVIGSTGTFEYIYIRGTGTGLTVYDKTVIGNGDTQYSLVQTHSTNTGALQVKGGVGIWGGVYASGSITGTNFNAINNVTVGGSLEVTGYSSLNGGATISAATVTNSLAVTGYSSLNGGATISAATVTNSLAVTGYSSLNGGATISAATVTNNLLVSGNQTVSNNLQVNGLFTASGTATFANLVNISGITSITNTTDSTTPTTGALKVSGGVGIAKNLNVGESVTVGSVTSGTVVNTLYSNNTLFSGYTSNHITSAVQTSLDTFSALTYRTAKYVIQIVDTNKIHVTEILLFHDGTDVYSTEYATFTNQGELGTFDATLAANTVTLKFTPTTTPTQMTVKVVRQLITS